MNAFEFVASLVNSLAWPVVVGVLIVVLRTQIRAIFARLGDRVADLKSLRGPGGTSAEFDDRVLDVKQEVSALPEPKSSADGQKQLDGGRDVAQDQDLIALAEASPRAAILEAWIALESSIRRLYGATNPRENAHQAPVNTMLRKLREQAADPLIDSINSMAELYYLRIQAAHSKNFEISSLAAYEYAESAYRLARIINGSIDAFQAIEDPG